MKAGWEEKGAMRKVEISMILMSLLLGMLIFASGIKRAGAPVSASITTPADQVSTRARIIGQGP